MLLNKNVTKVTEEYILVIEKDINGKQHFYICENMEDAKNWFSKDTQKQFITLLKGKR